MNKTVFSAVLLAAFLHADIGSTEGQGLPDPRHFGQITGDPEKDTFGYAARDLDAPRAVPSTLSDEPQYVGNRTGEEEKDTFGHVVLRPQAAASVPQMPDE